MFNRKMYLISIIAAATITVAAFIVWATQLLVFDWIYIFLFASVAYLLIKYKVSGPLQLFSTKFTMTVDYDLDVEGAVKLCEDAVANAPTKSVQALYELYLAMAKYYSADYEGAIRSFNMIDMKKLNPVYHVLIFTFKSYSAYELKDMELFATELDRVKGLVNRVNPKYQGFVQSYVEILEAMKNKEFALDQYKEIVEKHFTRNDGYISTKLVFNYRMAQYYEALGDTLEMDKCLAFCIANGKNHHTAVQARKLFKNSVDPADYIYKEEVKPEVVSSEEPKVIEEPKNDSENKQE